MRLSAMAWLASLRGPPLLLASVSSSSSLSANAERRKGFVQKAALSSRILRGSATMLVGKVVIAHGRPEHAGPLTPKGVA
jgi:hypothetical protein